MRKFCESLREHAMKMINFKKKKKIINKGTAEIMSKFKNVLHTFFFKRKFFCKKISLKKYETLRKC